MQGKLLYLKLYSVLLYLKNTISEAVYFKKGDNINKRIMGLGNVSPTFN